jgi:hypothetical protein
VTGRRAGVRALPLAGVLTLTVPAPPAVRAVQAEHAVACRYAVVGHVTDPEGHARLALRTNARAVVLVARFDPVESPTLFAGTLERFLAQ